MLQCKYMQDTINGAVPGIVDMYRHKGVDVVRENGKRVIVLLIIINQVL